MDPPITKIPGCATVIGILIFPKTYLLQFQFIVTSFILLFFKYSRRKIMNIIVSVVNSHLAQNARSDV